MTETGRKAECKFPGRSAGDIFYAFNAVYAEFTRFRLIPPSNAAFGLT
jgi:hypothetical protein